MRFSLAVRRICVFIAPFPPMSSTPSLSGSPSGSAGLFRRALAENPATFALALPIITGQLGQMLMGWADTIMVGRLGVGPLAACAFGSAVVNLFLVFGFGLVSSVSVRVSQEFGAKRYRQTGEVLLAGMLFALVAGLLMVGVVYLAWPWFGFLGQDPEVLRDSRDFLFLVVWSIVPGMLTTVAKDYAESLGWPWLSSGVILGGVGVNVGLNWLLIEGRAGFPALGLVGAGWGTLLARCVVTVVLFAILFGSRWFTPYRVWQMPWSRVRRHVAVLTRLGVPAGFHLMAEAGLFVASTLMMGWVGKPALAAHQVAMTCAGTAFMFPLGLGLAMTIRVGRAIGAGQPERVRPIAIGALGVGWLLLVCFALLFITSGGLIAGVFIGDHEVVMLTTQFLLIAGLFQLFDGTQMMSVGGLRGMGDVRVPMLLVYGCYWVIGLPVGYWLAFHAGWAGPGLWVGMALGLACMAVSVGTRLWVLSGRRIRPVVPVALLFAFGAFGLSGIGLLVKA